MVDPVVDPEEEARRQAKIREYSKNNSTGPVVLNRFETLLMQERGEQVQREEAERRAAQQARSAFVFFSVVCVCICLSVYAHNCVCVFSLLRGPAPFVAGGSKKRRIEVI